MTNHREAQAAFETEVQAEQFVSEVERISYEMGWRFDRSKGLETNSIRLDPISGWYLAWVQFPAGIDPDDIEIIYDRAFRTAQQKDKNATDAVRIVIVNDWKMYKHFRIMVHRGMTYAEDLAAEIQRRYVLNNQVVGWTDWFDLADVDWQELALEILTSRETYTDERVRPNREAI